MKSFPDVLSCLPGLVELTVIVYVYYRAVLDLVGYFFDVLPDGHLIYDHFEITIHQLHLRHVKAEVFREVLVLLHNFY